jgi:hypothetical protein
MARLASTSEGKGMTLAEADLSDGIESDLVFSFIKGKNSNREDG